MRAINAERRQQARNALKRLGINPEQPRGFAAQVQFTGWETELLALPFVGGVVGVDDPQALQDPVTGVPYFMVGISPVGSSDPVGAP